jgi:glutathione synthase/RimK-type ligase-like ATP-grasp enzyme
MAAKRVGVLEYHDEKYIKEVMGIVREKTGSEVFFFGVRDYDFSRLSNFNVIYDMISPFNRYLAEMMKIYFLNGAYIINNPFSITLYNKILQIYKLSEMKMPIPKTIALPDVPDKSEKSFVRKPFFKGILKHFKFPFIIKPYDGYANKDVFVINSGQDLHKICEEKKSHIMLIQEAIVPVDYYRVFVVNKKYVYFLKRHPRFIESKSFDFYDFSRLTPSLKRYISSKSIEISREMGYDISTIEWSITADKKAYIIDVNDAPNIADPKKAKKMDLHFPEEAYEWVVSKISRMIIEKLNIPSHKQHVYAKNNFTI